MVPVGETNENQTKVTFAPAIEEHCLLNKVGTLIMAKPLTMSKL